MKVLLVQPPVPDPAMAFSYATEPLGLETLGASIPDHDVALVDLRFEKSSLERLIERERPDVVATGGNTCNLYDLLDIAQRCKRLDARIHTVVGGHHATLCPADLAVDAVDAVVVGLGEEAFAELLSAWEHGRDASSVPGLCLRRDGEIQSTAERPLPKDLNRSPLPDRALTAAYTGRYRAFGRPVGLVNSARGCPYRCSFCSIVNEMGGRYLVKSPERLVEELAAVPQPLVRFADGNTFGQPKRAERLARALREADLGKELMVDARADTIVRHPRIFEAWREAGLRFVAVGFESVDDQALAAFGKESSLQDNIDALAVLRDLGLEVIGQFIVDPRFEEEDFDRLTDFIHAQGVHYPSFSIATPFPGTQLLEERRDEVVTRDWRRYDCMHSVMLPKLGWDGFYRRYMGLYEASYGPQRIWQGLRERLGRRRGRMAGSPLMTAAVALQVRISKRPIARAYGVRLP